MGRFYGETCDQEGALQAKFIYSAVRTAWVSVSRGVQELWRSQLFNVLRRGAEGS